MKISIIVQLYNSDYIEKCLDSIINQTYSNIEIIAVSSIKNKKNLDYLNKIANKDNRIKILNVDEKLSLMERRIKGSNKAEGEYISFVDCNDYLDIDFYRLLINNVKQNNSDVVISNYVLINDEKKEVFGLTFNSGNITYKDGKFKNVFFDQTGRNDRLTYTCNKLIKISLWKNVLDCVSGIKDKNKICDDIINSIILYNYAKVVSFCDNAIYYNRVYKLKNKSKVLSSKIKKITNSFEFVKTFVGSTYIDKIDIWQGYYIDRELNKLKAKEIKNI